MATFCSQFGQRNSTSSAVRTQFHTSDNGKRHEVRFLFSPEIVAMMGWKPGELLDVTSDGTSLVIEPSNGGRTLHGKPLFLELAFANSRLIEVNGFLGFDVSVKHFWENYDVQGRQLILCLTDIDVPNLP